MRIELGTSYDIVLGDVGAEIYDANEKFPAAYTSPHEGYAILAEEVDELWTAVKAAQKPRLFGSDREREEALREIRVEAIQVAAMAIRLVNDLDNDHFGKTAKR